MEILSKAIIAGRSSLSMVTAMWSCRSARSNGRCFPRSAVKAIQALPLIETGAADAYGLGDKELALACASHAGEVEHTALAAVDPRKAGLDEAALECGAHWPPTRMR